MRKLQRELRVLKERRICSFGPAFKARTDDLRDAPEVNLARRLLAAGAVAAFDLVVTALPDDLAAVRIAPTPLEAADAVDAVILATEWPELVTIKPLELRIAMTGEVVIDGRNALDATALAASGLNVFGVGW